jgi:hypothetical protein
MKSIQRAVILLNSSLGEQMIPQENPLTKWTTAKEETTLAKISVGVAFASFFLALLFATLQQKDASMFCSCLSAVGITQSVAHVLAARKIRAETQAAFG